MAAPGLLSDAAALRLAEAALAVAPIVFWRTLDGPGWCSVALWAFCAAVVHVVRETSRIRALPALLAYAALVVAVSCADGDSIDLSLQPYPNLTCLCPCSPSP